MQSSKEQQGKIKPFSVINAWEKWDANPSQGMLGRGGGCETPTGVCPSANTCSQVHCWWHPSGAAEGVGRGQTCWEGHLACLLDTDMVEGWVQGVDRVVAMCVEAGDQVMCLALKVGIFTHSSVGKEFAWKIGDLGSIPGSGRSTGEGNGNPLQCSCLENPMDRGPWQATVQGVERVRHDCVTKPPPPLKVERGKSWGPSGCAVCSPGRCPRRDSGGWGSRKGSCAGDTHLGVWEVEAATQRERTGKRTWATPEAPPLSAWGAGAENPGSQTGDSASRRKDSSNKVRMENLLKVIVTLKTSGECWGQNSLERGNTPPTWGLPNLYPKS